MFDAGLWVWAGKGCDGRGVRGVGESPIFVSGMERMSYCLLINPFVCVFLRLTVGFVCVFVRCHASGPLNDVTIRAVLARWIIYKSFFPVSRFREYTKGKYGFLAM